MVQSKSWHNDEYAKASSKRGNGDLGQVAKRETAITSQMVMSSLLRGLYVTLAAGVLIAFLGPFGTYERLPFLLRLAFWVSAIVGGFLFHMPIYWLARFFTQSKGWPIWIAILGSACVAALPTAVMVNGIAISMLNMVVADSLVKLYPMVLVLSVPLQILGHVSAFKGNMVEAPAPEPALMQASLPTGQSQSTDHTITVVAEPMAAKQTGSASFFARLPVRLGQDLLCLQMDDHYVRAWTARGSELILMRMADAARELTDARGLLVHRSFWVARDAVESWSRDGKNLTLHLSNGKNVPVARDRQAQIKAAGWLAGKNSSI